jgi:hypothetical protein
MRGNHFVNIIQNLQIIENAFNELKNKSNPTTFDFNDLSSKLKRIPGLGLSTYSKILYFFSINFNDNPCLIMDQRIIDIFKSCFYSDYLSLRQMHTTKK